MRTRFLRLLAVVYGFCAVSGVARAEVHYDTTFEGVDGEVESQLEQASQLVALVDKPPDIEAGLRRRAESDLDRLKEVMNSLGYYDAALSFTLKPGEDKDDFTVVVTIDSSVRYSLAEITLKTTDGFDPPDIGPFPPSSFGLELGKPALAEPVLAAEGKIALAYQAHGYPFAKVTAREVVIDSATKTMHVTYTLDPGAPAKFGAASIKGLTNLDAAYVERRLKWKAGDAYDQRELEGTRQLLVGTGLFSLVAVTPTGPVAADGTVPIQVNLVERPLHTLGAGGSYDTALGFDVNASWEDRDLFGGAEDLTVTAKGGQADSGLTIKFTRPDAFLTRNDFVATISADNELVEAFRSLDEEIEIGFRTQFDPKITAGYALEAEHARINEIVDSRVYTLVGVPLYLRQDASDDLLNPTTGYRAGIELTPYLRPLGSNLTYAQLRLNGSTYQRLGADDTYILAAQAILGATCCAALDAIPKDHRFYAGGGGSVRGFAFQKAGPLDQYDNAIGGRSLTVGSVELRALIMPNIQLVPFVDIGTDGARPLPSFSDKFYVGTGIGVRYLTPIGPIRFDIATPVNPHPQGDSVIQAYISIGQAF